MISPTLYSSKSDEWSTPDWLFDLLDKEFHFKLDAAASETNAKCPLYYTEENNGLLMPWRPGTWVNPPYTKGQISQWMGKAREEVKIGNWSVFLVPARTDTRWFHEHASKASEMRFIKGRLRFGVPICPRPGATAVELMENSAPFPSAIIVFGAWYVCGQKVTYWDPRAKA